MDEPIAFAAPTFVWPQGARIHVAAQEVRCRDGVGGAVLGMRQLFRAFGIPCDVYALRADPDLEDLPIEQLEGAVRPHDLLIFHYSTFDESFPTATALPCAKWIYFHNLTPTRFLRPFDELYEAGYQTCLEQMRDFDRWDGLCANSAKSLRELQTLTNHVVPKRLGVCPPMLDVARWRRLAAEPVDLPESRTLLLSVGRMVPQKKVEDLLSLFEHFTADSALLLAGWAKLPRYEEFIHERLRQLPTSVRARVHILDTLSDGQLKTVYQRASAFVTMTEHEGFCVPLAEAMHFDLPIFAFAEEAVCETLGGAGRTYGAKDFPTMARDMATTLDDRDGIRTIVARQRRRLVEIEQRANGAPIWDMIAEAMHARAV